MGNAQVTALDRPPGYRDTLGCVLCIDRIVLGASAENGADSRGSDETDRCPERDAPAQDSP